MSQQVWILMFCEIKGIYTSAFEAQLINQKFMDAHIILFYNIELYLFIFALSMIYVYIWIWTTCFDFTCNSNKTIRCTPSLIWISFLLHVAFFLNTLASEHKPSYINQVSVISQMFVKLLTWFGFKGSGWLWPFSDYFNLPRRRDQ